MTEYEWKSKVVVIVCFADGTFVELLEGKQFPKFPIINEKKIVRLLA